MERGSAEHENWLKSIDPTYVARTPDEAAPEPAPPEKFVTTDRLKSALGGIAGVVLKMINRKQAPLEARVLELEKRLSESSAPAWALADLAKQLAYLEKTLLSPVRPVYDENGKLIGAQRELN